MFATLNMEELGDVVIVNIDERKMESQYDDLSLFPKYLVRSMRKGIQQSSQQAGDHLARVFLRAMAFAIGEYRSTSAFARTHYPPIGNYANGFTLRSEKMDFDRELYLEQYLASSLYTFMSSVANTQMFEQVRSSMEHVRASVSCRLVLKVSHLRAVAARHGRG